MANGTLKVSNIQTSSGSGTITIGQSGETVTIPSGVTMTGMGRILQVINTSNNTNTIVSSTTYADTGLTASITPSSTSNKILIMISQDFQLETTTNSDAIIGGFKLLRDSTTLYTGSDDGNSFGVRIFDVADSTSRGFNFVWSYQYYDTPSSISSITYKTQCRTYNTNSRFRLNNQINGTSKSFITLMEIAG